MYDRLGACARAFCDVVRPVDSPVAFETLIHGIDIQPPSAVCACVRVVYALSCVVYVQLSYVVHKLDPSRGAAGPRFGNRFVDSTDGKEAHSQNRVC